MFESFRRSWELIKQSYGVLKSDRELLLFPLISMVGVVVVTIIFSVPLFFTGLLESAGQDGATGPKVLGGIVLFLFYLVMYTIIIYSNVALIGAAMIRLRGGDPTVNDGFRVANERLGKIVGYAAISATVGVLLSMLRNENNIVSKILAGILNFAWSVLTFLVVPVLVMEDVGPIEAIKRSGALLRRTWGEQLIANGGIGLVFGLITLLVIVVVGVPLFVLAASTESIVLMAGTVVLIVLIATLLGLFSSALNGVFQAALYNYAATGNVGPYFDESLINSAFKQKTSRRMF